LSLKKCGAAVSFGRKWEEVENESVMNYPEGLGVEGLMDCVQDIRWI